MRSTKEMTLLILLMISMMALSVVFNSQESFRIRIEDEIGRLAADSARKIASLSQDRDSLLAKKALLDESCKKYEAELESLKAERAKLKSENTLLAADNARYGLADGASCLYKLKSADDLNKYNDLLRPYLAELIQLTRSLFGSGELDESHVSAETSELWSQSMPFEDYMGKEIEELEIIIDFSELTEIENNNIKCSVLVKFADGAEFYFEKLHLNKQYGQIVSSVFED